MFSINRALFILSIIIGFQTYAESAFVPKISIHNISDAHILLSSSNVGNEIPLQLSPNQQVTIAGTPQSLYLRTNAEVSMYTYKVDFGESPFNRYERLFFENTTLTGSRWNIVPITQEMVAYAQQAHTDITIYMGGTDAAYVAILYIDRTYASDTIIFKNKTKKTQTIRIMQPEKPIEINLLAGKEYIYNNAYGVHALDLKLNGSPMNVRRWTKNWVFDMDLLHINATVITIELVPNACDPGDTLAIFKDTGLMDRAKLWVRKMRACIL